MLIRVPFWKKTVKAIQRSIVVLCFAVCLCFPTSMQSAINNNLWKAYCFIFSFRRAAMTCMNWMAEMRLCSDVRYRKLSVIEPNQSFVQKPLERAFYAVYIQDTIRILWHYLNKTFNPQFLWKFLIAGSFHCIKTDAFKYSLILYAFLSCQIISWGQAGIKNFLF